MYCDNILGHAHYVADVIIHVITGDTIHHILSSSHLIVTQISFQRWSNKYSNTSKHAVGYIGELNELTLTPNPDEVDQLFTVPLADLLDKNKWVIRDFSTPVFTGN